MLFAVLVVVIGVLLVVFVSGLIGVGPWRSLCPVDGPVMPGDRPLASWPDNSCGCCFGVDADDCPCRGPGACPGGCRAKPCGYGSRELSSLAGSGQGPDGVRG